MNDDVSVKCTKISTLNRRLWWGSLSVTLNKYGFICAEMCVQYTRLTGAGVWWKQGVTVCHQSHIWSLPASWQSFSPWLMFSDDNIWLLWLFLAALNGNYCRISSIGRSAAVWLNLFSFSLCLLSLSKRLPLHTSVLFNRSSMKCI